MPHRIFSHADVTTRAASPGPRYVRPYSLNPGDRGRHMAGGAPQAVSARNPGKERSGLMRNHGPLIPDAPTRRRFPQEV